MLARMRTHLDASTLGRVLLSLAAAAAFFPAACSDAQTSAQPPPGDPGVQSGPTFHRDVEPLLQKRCQSCHTAGGIAPFSLISYAEASPLALLIAETTGSRLMPPWGAQDTDECQTRHGWRNDERLSDDEIAMLAAWGAAGAPEGDPADAPPPAEVQPTELSGKDLEIAPKPFVTSGDRDEFRCFVLDPKLTEKIYINGTHFIAGNPSVVHHILLFADASRESEGKADADGGYDCFGGVGLTEQTMIAGWVPGGRPNDLPANIGTPVEAGSLLVMQIHYHPGGLTAEPDATRLQLRFTEGKPEYHLTTTLVGNFKGPMAGGGLLPGPGDGPNGPEFRIPAGASDHTETMQATIPGDPQTPEVFLYGVLAHMHLVGVDQKVAIQRAKVEPAEECLLHVPQWDFSWQRSYSYDAPVEDLPRLSPGDKLTLRCTYDNTLDNPALVGALTEENLSEPVDVRLGEETLDEMCITGLQLLTKAP
jgi:hypothetical protein